MTIVHHHENLYLFASSFLFLFTAFLAIQNLETTINAIDCPNCSNDSSGSCQAQDSLQCFDKVVTSCDFQCPANTLECTSSASSVSLGLMYFLMMLSSTCASVIPDAFGTKRSIEWSMSFYSLFCLANIGVAWFPRNVLLHWILLLPTSALVGIVAAVLWTAQGTYLTQIAQHYAESHNIPLPSALGLFNGVFWATYQSSQVFGNLISSLVLQEFKWSLATLFSIYFVISVAGNLLMGYVIPLSHRSVNAKGSPDDELEHLLSAPHPPPSWKGAKTSISNVLTKLVDPRALILTPIYLFNGLEQSFAWGGFTSNLLNPSLGQASIGYGMVAFGAADAISAYLTGKLARRIGQWPLLVVAMLIAVPTYIQLGMTVITPCDYQWTLLIISAIILGLVDGIVSTVICGKVDSGE